MNEEGGSASVEVAADPNMLKSLRSTIMEELRKETRAVLKAETENIRRRLAAAFERQIMDIIGEGSERTNIRATKKNTRTSRRVGSKTTMSQRGRRNRGRIALSVSGPVPRKKKDHVDVDALQRRSRRAKTALVKKTIGRREKNKGTRSATKLPTIASASLPAGSTGFPRTEEDEEDIEPEKGMGSMTNELLNRGKKLLASRAVSRAKMGRFERGKGNVKVEEIERSGTTEVKTMANTSTKGGIASLKSTKRRITDKTDDAQEAKEEGDTISPLNVRVTSKNILETLRPPPKRRPLMSLHVEEWENEIARNILSIYRAQLLGDVQNDNSEDTRVRKSVGGAREPPTQSSRNLPRHLRGCKRHPGVVWGGPLAKRFLRKQIWFAGGGVPRAVWCALAREEVREEDAMSEEDNGDDDDAATSAIICDHELCTRLRSFEVRGKYEKYVALIRTLLLAHLHNMRRENSTLSIDAGESQLFVRLWRQLVATGCAFVSRLIKDNLNRRALTMLDQLRQLSDDEEPLLRSCRRELLPYVYDTYAFYYFRRRKAEAGLDYLRRAVRFHRTCERWTHVAQCDLHRAALLGQLGRYEDAVRALGDILTAVDSGKLESVAYSQAESLCLIAVCYHNLAALEIRLQNFQQACVASQNARRLARLCLSVSSRYLKSFDATHRSALMAMVSAKEVTEAFSSDAQSSYFRKLASDLYT